MKVYRILTVACLISVSLFAGGVFCHRSELKSGYVVSDGISADECEFEIPSNKVEILKFMPKYQFIESGDIHCVVDFFIQYCQISTNFCRYEFARNQDNSRLEGLTIHFIDNAGNQILTIPCVNNGHDMVWDMERSRLVQLHGSFIMTCGRCGQLRQANSMYITDRFGNLLDDSGHKIVHVLSEGELRDLVGGLLSKMNDNLKRFQQ